MRHTLTIVRHGNTFGPEEAPRRIGARTDLPLVASGREQAIALGRCFQAEGRRFDRILTSPLVRTVETAALIAEHLDRPPPIESCDWLAEIDHGPDEDQPEEAVLARIGPEAIRAWDTQGLPPTGWQVDHDTRIAGWRSAFADAGDWLLVTSNGAARFAFQAEQQLSAQAAAPPSLKLRTGAFGRIVIDTDGPRIDSWDRRP